PAVREALEPLALERGEPAHEGFLADRQEALSRFAAARGQLMGDGRLHDLAALVLCEPDRYDSRLTVRRPSGLRTVLAAAEIPCYSEGDDRGAAARSVLTGIRTFGGE